MICVYDSNTFFTRGGASSSPVNLPQAYGKFQFLTFSHFHIFATNIFPFQKIEMN